VVQPAGSVVMIAPAGGSTTWYDIATAHRLGVEHAVMIG
jgi:hypothetical protein